MEIVNLSLSTGKMPDDYKNVLLIPLLKKISLDQEMANNFRPVSNLVYFSKLIEKVIASRLHSHMTNNNLYEELLSSYRKCHSTETALTYDDILRAFYDKKSVLLIISIWALLSITLTMMYFGKDLNQDWYLWNSLKLVQVILVWQITVCPDQWHSIKTNIISMWCTSRIYTWSNSIHYLHAAFGWHNQEVWNAVSFTCMQMIVNYTPLSHQNLIIAIFCSMVCLKNCLKNCKVLWIQLQGWSPDPGSLTI